MSVKRQIENSADDEARRIWGAMTRVVALTPETLLETPVHVATLKLDGCRVGLSCKAGVCSRINAVGRSVLEGDNDQKDFVLDAEEHGGVFWVFDALMVDAHDIRSLALADRLLSLAHLLEKLKSIGGKELRMKPYRSLRSAEALHRLLADSTTGESCDGVIFCDYTGVYETPAFKFKQRLTVDFCLESSLRGSVGTFTLLTQVAGRLKAFKLHGEPCELLLSCLELASFAIPDEVKRGDACILECLLPEGRHGKWKAVRRRLDRKSPNCLRTVLDTMEMNRKGFDEAGFLHRHLPPLATKAAHGAWLAVLRRRILRDDGCPGVDERVVEVHGASHTGYGGSVRVDHSRLALPIEGKVLVRAFFSLSDVDIERLFAILRTWLEGASNRELRLLVAVQLAQEGLSSLDARYFGCILESTTEALTTSAAQSVGSATLVRLQDSQPPELLQLPPMLSSLAEGTSLLRASSAPQASQVDAPQTL